MPADHRAELAISHRLQHGLEAGTGATGVGGQVVIGVAVGDLPSELIGECLAVLQLAGHTGALSRGVLADSGVDGCAHALEYMCADLRQHPGSALLVPEPLRSNGRASPVRSSLCPAAVVCRAGGGDAQVAT